MKLSSRRAVGKAAAFHNGDASGYLKRRVGRRLFTIVNSGRRRPFDSESFASPRIMMCPHGAIPAIDEQLLGPIKDVAVDAIAPAIETAKMLLYRVMEVEFSGRPEN